MALLVTTLWGKCRGCAGAGQQSRIGSAFAFQPCAHFAQLCPGIEFLRAHLAPRLCKAVIGFAKPARQAPGSPGQAKRPGTADDRKDADQRKDGRGQHQQQRSPEIHQPQPARRIGDAVRRREHAALPDAARGPPALCGFPAAEHLRGHAGCLCKLAPARPARVRNSGTQIRATNPVSRPRAGN